MLKKILKNKFLIAGLVVILAVSGYLIWRYLDRKNGGEQEYMTTTVGRSDLISSVSASGNVLSANLIPVTTQASGVISTVYVNEGDEVAEGQKILDITLDAEGRDSLAQAQASYLSAKNNLESAKSRLYSLDNALRDKEDAFDHVKETTSYQTDEEQDLFHDAENEYLLAKSDYDLQIEKIKEAEISLQKAYLSYQSALPYVTAPSAGVITGISFIEGMRLNSEQTSSGSATSQTIASIKTGGAPLISVNVSEIDVPEIQVGQKATVTVDSIPDKTFTGEVVTVDRVGELSSGVSNYPVIIQLDSNAKEILSNMGITAEIIVAKEDNVLTVPTTAVQEQNGNSFVRVLEGGEPHYVAVKTGLSSLSEVQILDGVSEGDEVIVNNLSTGSTTDAGQEESRDRFDPGMIRMMR
jgi:RND family efflux transporter MFP subunit